jgi:diguanylate cyclase (GGDEF)-like protein
MGKSLKGRNNSYQRGYMNRKHLTAYSRISKILLNSGFKWKLASVAILGTYFQLIAVTLYLLLKPNLNQQALLQIFFSMLIATLVGTAMTIYATKVLTAPISLISKALCDYIDHKKLPNLPLNFSDETGRLMADVQHLIMKSDELSNLFEQTSALDHLTGVYNRYWSEAHLKEEIKRLKRTERTLSIVMIDIDCFNCINEQYGHAAGDLCLKHIANIIRLNIRGTDWIARWGGDEFLVAMYDTNKDTVIKALDRIRRTVKERPVIAPDGTQVYVSVSLGICQYADGDSSDTILYKADKALFKAKLYGRDQIIQDYIRLAG